MATAKKASKSTKNPDRHKKSEHIIIDTKKKTIQIIDDGTVLTPMENQYIQLLQAEGYALDGFVAKRSSEKRNKQWFQDNSTEEEWAEYERLKAKYKQEAEEIKATAKTDEERKQAKGAVLKAWREFLTYWYGRHMDLAPASRLNAETE